MRRQLLIVFLGAVLIAESALGGRTIQFNNQCGRDIWVSPSTNANQGPTLDIAKIGNGGSYTYNIPDSGWGGRFWPKLDCDGSGQNCAVGQSVPPCPSGGCQPPADTKVEFYFPQVGGNSVWYDISLVDGYSLPAQIVPSNQGGSCVTTNCAVSLDACPTSENNVGDLRVFNSNGQVTSCLSPCKKWNYPPNYGMGRSEQENPGQMYCCPTPPVTVEQCRAGPVVQTQYVNLIHNSCPSAYSYAYDDEGGLHNCVNDSSFQVTFCP